ncbi:TetR/AcrR family transcriptional regulator C-terminal domain-containing protein [Kitasatospora sp. NPDC094019]|uniref:TetR/AcrR family transcriptional regulator C-terminal domain-containing protein n=1 Tax=Kitasatospora sp. NPDC094019 TaxID=3364091 RepID=UPI0038186341
MAPETDPPFRRIAADLRRRIATGELGPGARVPSTRRLAQDWGVALATATKALTVLRSEGLIEARPRVGTVVAAAATAAAPRPAAAEGELSRERLIAAALDIADTEGLAALSMRAVAARLGTAPMSAYRHVTSKDELVLLAADAAFGEARYPADPPDGWRPRLELGARTLWGLFRRHPWLAELGSVTRPLLLPNLLTHAEWALSALDGHGLPAAGVLDIHVLLYSYIEGLAANLEREARAQAATGLTGDQWTDTRFATLDPRTAAARYPVFTRLMTELGDSGYDLDLDTLFESGLTTLLDGLTARIEGAGRG